MAFGTEIGTISIGTSLDLKGFQQDRQRLVRDANKLADDIANRFSGAISGSFSGAGKGLADSLTRDLPRQGLQIQNSLGGTITGAILRANFATAIAGQVVQGFMSAASLITRPLQNIVSAVSGSISEGLSFQNASRIRTEILSVSSALSGVAEISFDQAQMSIEGLNQRLAESAAALPGTTEGFLRIARGISDEIARASRDAETGLFDARRWEDTTSRLSELAGVLDAASIQNVGLTTMGLSRALGGESVASLRQLQLFQDNPTLLSSIESQLATIGAESLRDVTLEGRALILERALETVVTPELLDRASESADGLIQAFLSRLGDPTGGIFSISRELSSTGASVFDTLTETLRLSIGEGSGLFDRFASAAEDAGLRIGDPMEALQSAILRVNEAIARLAENTDEFFASDIGQGLVDILNTIQTRVPQAFGFLIRLGGEILPVVISGLRTVAQVADSVFSAIAYAIPDLSGIRSAVESIADGLALARDYALSFFEAFTANVDLSGFLEAGSNAIAAFNQLLGRTSTAVGNFVSENRETIVGVGETLGGIFGSGVSAIGDLVAAAQRTLVPVLQRAGELLGGVFNSIWDGLRPLREWFASDETRSFLGDAVEGLGRIGEILIRIVGDGLIRTLDLLDKIFVRSGALELVFGAISTAVGVVATGIGGLLNLVGRWDEVTQAVSGSFSAIANIVELNIRRAISAVVILIRDRFGPAAESVQGIFASIVETVQNIWNWLDQTLNISERLSGPFEVVRNIVQEIVEFISNMFGGLQRILGLGDRAQQGQAFQPGGVQSGGGFVSPLQGRSLQQVVDYQQSAGQDFDAYRAYRQGYHAGIDFDARIGGGEGGIVQAVTDGVVTEINELFSNAEGAGGSVQVRIETTDTTGQTVQQRFTHLSRQAVQEAGLQVGQQVRAGQIIGAVGSRDSVSSGAHLDYKVTVNGQFVNPDEFLSLAGAAGTLTTLDVRSGQQGQVNVGAIAPQRPQGGLGGRLAGGAGLGAGAFQVDPVYSGLLQRFGGDRTIASAFYGNFVQESGLDTTAVNEIGASGLAQWLGSRKEELMAFADQMGKEWTDLDVQLDFVLRELETSESAAWEKIREVAARGDVGATTRAVRQYYERPGEHEAADDRRIAAAEQAFAQSGGTTSPPTTDDLRQFLDPAQRAQRELAEAQRILNREGQLRSQARQDEDRVRQLEREQREDALRARQAELDPRDTAGAAIIDAQIRALQIADQISDRILQNERNITDLVDARELQSRQRENLEQQRGAFEQAIATGGQTSITEEGLRKLESEISPIDFTEAIANLRQYGEELDTLRADKLRPIQASLSNLATQAVEDSRNILQAVDQLNRQYSDPSAFAQHQAAIEAVQLAYEENGRQLDQTISKLTQLSQIENLSEEQYANLTTQLAAATQAREDLNAAEERAIAIAEEQYQIQQQRSRLSLAQELLAPQVNLQRARADAETDPFRANAINRDISALQIEISTQEQLIANDERRLQLHRMLSDAQTEGDRDTISLFEEFGLGSNEAIDEFAENQRLAIVESAELGYQQVMQQFPTLAESFRETLKSATQSGLAEGFAGLASGELGIGEAFKRFFDGIFNSVIQAGAQRLSSVITGGLFGGQSGGGLLGGILGGNASAIPGGGGGGGLFGAIGNIFSSLFSGGGLVRNYAGDGLAEAMTRERLASGRNPRLAVVNDGEFVFKAAAVDRIGVKNLEALHNGYVPNYAIGGSITREVFSEAPIHGQYHTPVQTNIRPQRVEYRFQSEIINQREYVSRDQLDLLEEKVNAAPRQGAAQAIEALRSSPQVRSRAGL